MSLEVIRDILQIVFFATGIIVAWIGLWKWRTELRGKTEYEAAKQALAKAYSLRDQIRMAQSPMMFAEEWSERKPSEPESDHDRRVRDSYYAYGRRFQRVQDSLDQLYPVMVEAEAVFGDEARVRLENLARMANRLWAAITVYHQGLARHWENPGGPNDRLFNIMYGINEFDNPDLEIDGKSVDDDNFKRDLDMAVQEIKEFFIPRLNRIPPRL